MKKIIFTFAAVLCITTISCRQEDEVLSNEDIATIKIIEANRNDESSNPDQIMKRDSANNGGNTDSNLDGEIQAPPRK